MKKAFIFLVMILIVGCGKTKEPVKKVETNQEPVQEMEKKTEVPVKYENFLEEDYVDYPGVGNVIKYLKINPKDVKILHETDQRLVFCFYQEDADVHDQTTISVYNYIRQEDAKNMVGVELYDGTISGTFELSYDDDYICKITKISETEIESWKADVKDWWNQNEENKKDEYNIDLITNENTVCIIKKVN